MTQYSRRALPLGKIALLIAALAVAFAVGVSISKDDGRASGAAEVAAGSGEPAIAGLEAKTQNDPANVSAWRQLGQAYFDEGRFAESAGAFEKASALAPSEAAIWSALGEARVMASRTDPMPEPAVAAFRRAAELEPGDPRARYFLAVERDLGGDHAGAIGDWLALLEDTPADAPWRPDLIRTIEQVGKIHRIEVASRLAAAGAQSPPAAPMPAAARAIPGPSAQDLAAASRIPPREQQQMAEGMVARLEARLDTDPANVDGWIMLMRSRMTLGEPVKAAQALRDALAANPGQADHLRQQAAVLGVR